MRFEFATSGRIIFGPGSVAEVPALAAHMGTKAMVVAYLPEAAEALRRSLAEKGVPSALYTVEGEPTVAIAREGVAYARQQGCDVVIGIGGGSSVDTGKAIAALFTNEGDPLDYLEVIGRGKALANAPLPYIAIPTTSGTGAEVTRNAVLASPEHKQKVSLRSPLMLPKVAVLDPELTHSAPPAVTASTGLDALTQVIEPFVSNKANPIADAFCREGIARGARSLRRAYLNGSDAEAREDMALTSLCGGLALANAGLGAAHGFAAPIGGMFHAPHGATCAVLLPHVTAVNVRALSERQPESPILGRYGEIARIVTGDPQATVADGVAWLAALCRDLKVPPLSAYGMTAADVPMLVEMGAAASSMKANPLKLTPEEMTEILTAALN